MRITLFILCNILMLPLVAQETLLDQFETVSYSNNDGTLNWSTNWIEFGGNNDPSSGFFSITNNGPLNDILLMTNLNVNDQYIQREADLSTAAVATLRFDYTSDLAGNGGASERVYLLISNDGGSTFTQIGDFRGIGSGAYSRNITASASANTVFRFIGANRDMGLSSFFTVDNFRIEITIDKRTMVTNRSITYRVNPAPSALPTNKIIIDNFDDTGTFDVVLRNSTGEVLNYQFIVENVPYASIPNLIPGDHTYNLISNGNGTYTHIFTSTVPFAPFENNRRIRGDAVTPPGIDLACGCVYLIEL